MNKLNLILISGKALSGKDTVANLYKRNKPSSKIFHIADSLKQLLYETYNEVYSGVKIETFYEDKDKFHSQLNTMPRLLLQHFGTNCRQYFGDAIWISKLHDDILNSNSDVIIPDIRFQDELDYCRQYFNNKFNIRSIHMNRKTTINNGTNHISENGELKYDILINNDSTLKDLETIVNVLSRGKN